MVYILNLLFLNKIDLSCMADFFASITILKVLIAFMVSGLVCFLLHKLKKFFNAMRWVSFFLKVINLVL